MRYNKYSNKKCEMDGYKFDSKKEMNRYAELKLMERGKIITQLRLQPRFTIHVGFTHPEHGKQRKIEYVADFEYIENGRRVVEDVKGIPTDVYKMKKKMFLFLYPEIKFTEI
jgi:hypothetical protein